MNEYNALIDAKLDNTGVIDNSERFKKFINTVVPPAKIYFPAGQYKFSSETIIEEKRIENELR